MSSPLVKVSSATPPTGSPSDDHDRRDPRGWAAASASRACRLVGRRRLVGARTWSSARPSVVEPESESSSSSTQDEEQRDRDDHGEHGDQDSAEWRFPWRGILRARLKAAQALEPAHRASRSAILARVRGLSGAGGCRAAGHRVEGNELDELTGKLLRPRGRARARRLRDRRHAGRRDAQRPRSRSTPGVMTFTAGRAVHVQLHLPGRRRTPTSARPPTARAPARPPRPTAATAARCRSARRSRSTAPPSPGRWSTTRG